MTCDHCGHAVDVRRLAILVDGRLELEQRLCHEHRRAIFELLQRLARLGEATRV